MMKSMYTVEVETDPETGELVLPFPDELIEQMGWEIGDTLIWGSSDQGIFLTKKDETK